MPDTAATITVTLPSTLLDSLEHSVEAGEFASTDDAVENAVRLWERRRVEQAESLNDIRLRVRRSLDDPSPDLSEEEMDAHFEALFAEAARDTRDATT